MKEPVTPNWPDPAGHDPSPYTKTYVAIDGMDPEQITQKQMRTIERILLSAVLGDMGEPIDDVRVIDPEHTNVFEVDIHND